MRPACARRRRSRSSAPISPSTARRSPIAPSAHATCSRTPASLSFSASTSAGTASELSSAPSAHAPRRRTAASVSCSVRASSGTALRLPQRAERPRGVLARDPGGPRERLRQRLVRRRADRDERRGRLFARRRRVLGPAAVPPRALAADRSVHRRSVVEHRREAAEHRRRAAPELAQLARGARSHDRIGGT